MDAHFLVCYKMDVKIYGNLQFNKLSNETFLIHPKVNVT